MTRTVYEMAYNHPVKEKASVDLVPYSPGFQAEYKRIYNECFHEMREALGIKPFDFIQDDSFFETGMDAVFLLTVNGRLIGSVALRGNEIDDLIVAPACQGMGYGRQILLWALAHIRSDRIILHVAAWNRKAVALYQKTGFVITEAMEIPSERGGQDPWQEK